MPFDIPCPRNSFILLSISRSARNMQILFFIVTHRRAFYTDTRKSAGFF
jgi:hypothetical protein